MAFLALVLSLTVVRHVAALPAGLALPWWVLAVLFYLVEVRVVHFQFRREAYSFSLSEIPLVIGLFLATPADLVMAYLVGGGAGLLIHRRPPPLKLFFNLSLFGLQAVVAILVFRQVVAPDGIGSMISWAAAFAATFTANVLGLSAVGAAVRIVEGLHVGPRLNQAVHFGLAVGMTNTTVALMAVGVLSFDPVGFWLLAVPAVLVLVAFRSYRAYVAERDQAESLELLYEATRILHGSSDLDAAVAALLTGARRKFRAELAQIVLFADESRTTVVRATLGPDEVLIPMAAARFDPLIDTLIARTLEEPRAHVAARVRLPDFRPDRINGAAIRDALVAPLTGEQSLMGVVMVANREGNVSSFREDELRLFQTLANHAGVALENGQLGRSLKSVSEEKEQLQYQAFHDPLTGLANRALFLDRVGHALSRRPREGNVPVVLFVDLDDFKSVNDSHGHATGDELLRMVAGRLSHCIRPSDLAVRLGGDEFAVLVEDGRDLGAVIRIAERVIDAVKQPMEIAGRTVSTRASVGVAASHSRYEGADQLLRNADVAMYTAKTRGKDRFAVFDPSMDAEVNERRATRAALRRALREERFVVHYQPITDLETSEVTAVEALVRWRHPERGLLRPDQFLSLAEETGLIVPIGRWVLEESCRQVRAWQLKGRERLGLSINVSARQLSQPEFADETVDTLARTGLAHASLTIEVGEELIVADRPAVQANLHRLRNQGIRLAIDDFGGGLSSLGQLARFPVDVLKIAKTHVVGVERADGASRVAEGIVALGHSLQLSVVAKGIEHPDQVGQLRAFGCDAGQGYYLCRPMEGGELGSFLGSRAPVTGGAAA
jgi:diguanylate cyclase (GGDEF)-like protein